MPISAVHPTTRLILWLVLMLLIQWLDGWLLVSFFLLLPPLGWKVMQRGGRLVWRARWLLLSLFVIFVWGVPGDPLWVGVAAPTREGLDAALLHLGRLLLMLMSVAAFLETMPLPQLLSATHRLMYPLHRLGFDHDRGVVRLMLVLRYVETLPRPRDWRALLDAPVGSASETLELDDYPLRWIDYLVLLLAGAAVVFFGFR